jgi:hypothetical protein
MTLDLYLLTLYNIKLLCVSLVYPWFLLHSVLSQNTTLHYKCSILCVIQVICTYGHANIASGWQDEVWRFPDRIGFIKRTTCFLEKNLQKWSFQEKIFVLPVMMKEKDWIVEGSSRACSINRNLPYSSLRLNFRYGSSGWEAAAVSLWDAVYRPEF